MANLAALKKFEAGARSDTPQQAVRPSVPESSSPAQQISRLFLYQSFFDDALLARAILPQLTNEPIVASTAREEQTAGYAIGLHPSSQTPVAVQFKIGGQSTSSQAIILKPGQIVRPHGLPPGMKAGSFSAFTWGLPFGWLGGGVATLLVFQTPDADVLWPGNPEVIFHRQRMEIQDGGALPANAPFNWPIRFPWVNAIQGAGSLNQRGDPEVAVDPTRTLMRLRLAALGAPADMRVIYQASSDFDVDQDGNPILTPVVAFDMTWGIWASFGAGNLGDQHQFQSLPDLGFKIGADQGGVVLASTNADLIGEFVDVVRYGRIG